MPAAEPRGYTFVDADIGGGAFARVFLVRNEARCRFTSRHEQAEASKGVASCRRLCSLLSAELRDSADIFCARVPTQATQDLQAMKRGLLAAFCEKIGQHVLECQA